MLLSAEIIHQKAGRLVKRCGTRDTVKIAEETGVYVHFCNDFETLLGMYTYMQKERHILLNANMDTPILQMVCGHELGHDVLHRRLAKTMGVLPETLLFDRKNTTEYEANAFSAHLCIDDRILQDLLPMSCSVEQLAASAGVHVNLMLVKLHELKRMGWELNLPYIPRAGFLGMIRPEV
mgnify:CR=1 FL=1